MFKSHNEISNNNVQNSLTKENLPILPCSNTKGFNSFYIEDQEENKKEKKSFFFETDNSFYEKEETYNCFTPLNVENIDNNSFIKNDTIDKLSTNSNINININQLNQKVKKNYRKDAYYKHFKTFFGKYLKNEANKLKNKCFPEYRKNNFSTPNYSYIGNPKEKDNYNFLFYKVKDILIYDKNQSKHNRQYNNYLIIKYIEENKQKTKDLKCYEQINTFLNISIEKAFINFYNDKKQFEIINRDENCIYFDKYFKENTGISLLEKYGFIKAMMKHIKN